MCRMNQTMTRMLKMREEEYSTFLRVLFGMESPSPVPEKLDGSEMEWVDESLNDSQKEAIMFALASREVALIHGPPGVCYTCFYGCGAMLTLLLDRQDSYSNRAYPTNVE